VPRTPDNRSPREMSAMENWSYWLERMLHESNLSQDDLKKTCGIANRELNLHLSGEMMPMPKTAYAVGEFFGSRILHISGVSGLYAAAHVSSVIHLMNQAIPCMGIGPALIILATLPYCVEMELSSTSEAMVDLESARVLASRSFERYGTILGSVANPIARDAGARLFNAWPEMPRASFYEAYRTAIALERKNDSTLREIRNACFPTIFLAYRGDFFSPNDAEQLFNNFRGYELWHPCIEPVALKELKWWLELGRRFSIGPNYRDSSPNEIPVGSRHGMIA